MQDIFNENFLAELPRRCLRPPPAPGLAGAWQLRADLEAAVAGGGGAEDPRCLKFLLAPHELVVGMPPWWQETLGAERAPL